LAAFIPVRWERFMLRTFALFVWAFALAPGDPGFLSWFTGLLLIFCLGAVEARHTSD